MALLDNEKNSNKNDNATDKLFLGIIITLILAVVIVIVIMIYFISNGNIESKQSIYLDGIQNSALENSIISQNNVYYIPIKEIANAVEYEAYNGDYINVSEDTTKCHVIINEDEVIQFRSGSNKANKIKYGQNVAYVELTLQKPIISVDYNLYIALEDIQNALYIFCEVNSQNMIQLYSLENVYNIYNQHVIGLGYKEIVNNINNQKAILNNVLICKNNKNKYGVINSSGEVVIETKYDNIEYVQETDDFIVTYNGIKGILHDKQTKINISYEDIKYISYANLYAVTSNSKIGFFNIDGKKIIDLQFEGIGSQTHVKNACSVEYVTTKGLLVVKNNGKYGLINKEGTVVVDFNLDDVYSIIINGNLEYYVIINGVSKNLNTII